MQREKLYNLHKTTYSVVVLFVSRVDRILASEPPSCKKDNIFDIWQPKFLLSHPSITKAGYQKRNTTQHEMQREKLYNLHSNADCNCFQKEENSL